MNLKKPSESGRIYPGKACSFRHHEYERSILYSPSDTPQGPGGVIFFLKEDLARDSLD
jgi:hypothetical protein